MSDDITGSEGLRAAQIGYKQCENDKGSRQKHDLQDATKPAAAFYSRRCSDSCHTGIPTAW